ncbi:MAG TPA: hypothetical protein PK283_08840, partial [Thiotrichales bacterium]|nr:hypothetical protein [Thiotrichales bacterium]
MKIDQIAKWLIIATPPLIIALSQQQQTLAALAATIFTIAYLIFSFYEIKNLLINKFSKKDNEQSDKSESATEKEATT